jgi:small subunit ribosomal protein S2
MDLGAADAPIVDVPVSTGDASGFELLTAPRGAPDDLARLQGVGPQIVKKLNDYGIYHYWQLAAMSPADVDKADRDLKLSGRIARDGWIDQAKALAAE